ncbi:hypothetical protein DFJ58DRAFT_791694 [Suillus subalutaceus]|uniref:uncharacterized protein n=1 Tax=Suillus subalutaceus TaxID=48586 RepID=UPI001B86304A|nr:uncharacterized protein DFJ58DRAFT_791694 [Suillus subalutaceus]KAG1852136.1 hypothetical protein DFJ58DRAFT_791694 [Suillus subalutaceus]
MKYESRKFIDLIQGVTSKWVNWDPPRPINVGDYGMINNETGEFDWEGNLYKTTSNIGIDMTDPALRPIEQDEGDDKYIVKSWGVTTKELNVSAEADVPGGVNVALKVNFQFDGRKPAAALVMYKPRYISLPNNERIILLLKSRPDVLKGKYVVTEVISCAAYMMYMSSQSKAENFTVTLKATGPVVPAVNAGGAAGFTWSAETICGLYREGSNSTLKYMPLYRLKKPRHKFWWPFGQRGDEKIDDAIDRWEDVDPPWDPLDDEGEEDEIYDAEMHGDFGVFNDGYPDNDDDL